MLGDPKWQARFNLNGKVGVIDFGYTPAMSAGRSCRAWCTRRSSPRRSTGPHPDARPFVYYSPIVYHDARIGVNATEKFRLYLGVDNIKQLPPL